jgi:predicted DNA-binding transcriptional regulator YafY
MYDPSMRVLTVLELMQGRERISGRELAERLEVSPRTVQRYVARLQDLGVPVEATRGPGGAYRLKPGFRMPPLMFGTEEAFALALGLDALAHLGLGEIAPATAGAKAKLERVMPTAIAERVRGVRSALLLDRPRRMVNADIGLLIELATACSALHRIELTYRSSEDRTTVRTVDPYGLIQHDGRWFLAGFCHLRQDVRLFRVDRIEIAEPLSDGFEPPLAFDLRAFLYERFAMASAPWQIEVWFDASPERVEARLPRAMAIVTADKTGAMMRCTTTSLEELALTLLQTGLPMQIRTPSELHGAFRSVAERALDVADQSH